MLILSSFYLHLSALSHLHFKVPVTVLPFKAAFKDFHLHSPCQHSDTYYSIQAHSAGTSSASLHTPEEQLLERF